MGVTRVFPLRGVDRLCRKGKDGWPSLTENSVLPSQAVLMRKTVPSTNSPVNESQNGFQRRTTMSRAAGRERFVSERPRSSMSHASAPMR